MSLPRSLTKPDGVGNRTLFVYGIKPHTGPDPWEDRVGGFWAALNDDRRAIRIKLAFLVLIMLLWGLIERW